MRASRPIPADVRAALAAFLNQCQNEARPFAGTEALGAVRTMFPELDISDADLEDAISGQAENAGFDVGYEPRTGTTAVKAAAIEAQRRIDNDTDGTRRRAKAKKDRNQLI